MGNYIDLTGKTFARLTVQSRAEQKTADNRWQWHCLCACGKTTLVRGASLQAGNTTSCGCVRRETNGRAARSHGQSDTPEYAAWLTIRAQCHNPQNVRYPRFGGRGIRVCTRWDVFELFLEDMGKRPSDRHFLDRKNQLVDFQPGNCVWSSESKRRSA